VTTILLTAVGSPGAPALIRALRDGADTPARIVGVDLRDEAIGRFLCDAFSTVPPSDAPAFADAVLAFAHAEGVQVVLPQASIDVPALAERRDDFEAAGITLISASPAAVARADSKLELLRVCAEQGVRAPAFREAQGAEALTAAARELGYPEREVCFKPVHAAGSRGFRVLSAGVDRRQQLLHERPGSIAHRLEEAAEIIGDDPTPLVVMEYVAGGERTVDGYAEGGRIVVGHAKTREAMRAGLAMRFETLADPDLMDTAARLVAALELDGFFNLQLVGDAVIELNPRISTIVYQPDYNLAWLGVRRALGRLSDTEAAEAQARVQPGRVAIRYFDQIEIGPA
jgi:carbamoyl-phosphate synthase large subunit